MKSISYEKKLNLCRELEIYREIYKLNELKMSSEVNKEFFEYCEKRRFFVLLVVYDCQGKIYLQESGVNELKLPGGSVKEEQDIRSAVKKIVSNIEEGIEISELEPIAFLENQFIYKDKRTIHTGIAMIVRAINIQVDNSDVQFFPVTKGVLENVKDFANKEVIQEFEQRYQEIVKQNNKDFQDEEIETNAKHKIRYKFHNSFVKRFILTSRLKKKNELICLMKQKINHARNMLDVSCGDNSLLFNFNSLESTEYIVANDISWSQIELIEPKDKVMFTNHNAIAFPFKDDSFEFVYCSNTLHHIPTTENMVNFLDSLLRVGKKLVIYEIEAPEVTGGFPYILNKYWYRGFLKDVGENYLSFEQFKQLIISVYSNKAKISFSAFKNVQGNYMIAEIIKK